MQTRSMQNAELCSGRESCFELWKGCVGVLPPLKSWGLLAISSTLTVTSPSHAVIKGASNSSCMMCVSSNWDRGSATTKRTEPCRQDEGGLTTRIPLPAPSLAAVSPLRSSYRKLLPISKNDVDMAAVETH